MAAQARPRIEGHEAERLGGGGLDDLFVALVDGLDDRVVVAARRVMNVSAWDPRGTTSYAATDMGFAGEAQRLYGLLSLGWDGSRKTWSRYETLSLVLAGLAAKIGWAPVHNWLPDAHSEAPPPVSAESFATSSRWAPVRSR